MNSLSKKEALNKLPFFISYFITDPIEFGDTANILKKNLENSIKNNNINMICFRDKISKDKDIEPLAKTTLNLANKYNIISVINGDIKLALQLGFNGVHLRSIQFNEIEFANQNNLITIVSCHNEDDIKKAKQLKANIVTYSPIFYKESKGDPKGIENLNYTVKKYQNNNFKIIALGGIITDEQVKQIKSTNCNGFASIRYFSSTNK